MFNYTEDLGVLVGRLMDIEAAIHLQESVGFKVSSRLISMRNWLDLQIDMILSPVDELGVA